MISYISFISTIRAFADEHLQVQKFGAEFKEQMPNIATTDEAFPFLFVVPMGNSVKEFTKELEVDIYCVDRLQKDRTNTNYIVSDTELILTDLEVWLDDVEWFDLLRTSPITPINNDLLDYCAGNVMRVRVDMEKQTVCEIPFEGNEPPPIPTCDDAAYIAEYVDGTPIESGTIPSGGSKLITVPNCEDAAAVLKNTLDEILSTTPIESGASQDIEAPDSTYTVEYENGTPIESGYIPSGNNKVIEVPNPIVCSDTNLQVNTVGVGAFPSGSTIDVQLTDGTNPVTPVSVGVVGDVVTVEVDTSGGFPMLPSGTYTPKNTISGAFDLLWTGLTTGMTSGDGFIERISGADDFLGGGYFLIPHYGDFEVFFKMQLVSYSVYPMGGLSYYHSQAYYQNLDMAIYNASPTTQVFENRDFKGNFGSGNPDTVYSFERDVNTMQIHYKKDGVAFRSVPITNIGSMNFDTSFPGQVIIKDIIVVVP